LPFNVKGRFQQAPSNAWDGHCGLTSCHLSFYELLEKPSFGVVVRRPVAASLRNLQKELLGPQTALRGFSGLHYAAIFMMQLALVGGCCFFKG
jgi:hypothetical protein